MRKKILFRAIAVIIVAIVCYVLIPGTFEFEVTASNQSDYSRVFELEVLPSSESVMLPVHVTAQRFKIPEAAPQVVDVEDATVRLYKGRGRDAEFVRSARTLSSGVAHIFIGDLSEEDLREATVVAYAEIYSGSGLDDTGRNPLFRWFGTDNEGNPTRFILQLRSEELDSEGNWVGEPLFSHINSRGSAQVNQPIELRLEAPRLLVNLAVSYLDYENARQRQDYERRLKSAMSLVSELLAEATDGHVFLNEVILMPVSSRFDFYYIYGETPGLASMADIRIETRADENIHMVRNAQIHPNANINGFFRGSSTRTDETELANFFGLFPQEREELLSRRSFPRIQMGERWQGYFHETDTFVILPQTVGNRRFSNTIVHELGHYLFGLFDEFLRGDGRDIYSLLSPFWYPLGGPRHFGLMHNQHSNIRLSRSEYHYNFYGAFSDNPRRNTLHSLRYRASTEQVVADFLTQLRTSDVTSALGGLSHHPSNWQFAHSDFVINYSLDPIANYVYCFVTFEYIGGKPRTATYPFAALSDNSFIIIPRDEDVS